MEPRKAEVGKSIQWIKTSWAIFKMRPFFWVSLTIGYFILSWILNMIPIVGWIISFFVGPAFTGITVLASNRYHKSGKMDFAEVFSAVVKKWPTAIVYSLLLLAIGSVVALLPVALLSWNLPWSQMLASDPSKMAESVSQAIVALGIPSVLLMIGYVSVVGMLLAMLSFFAPILIFLKDTTPAQSMGLSLRCCLVNWLSLTVWGLLMSLVALLSLIPLGLGLLISGPMFYIGTYVIVDDVFSSGSSGDMLRNS